MRIQSYYRITYLVAILAVLLAASAGWNANAAIPPMQSAAFDIDPGVDYGLVNSPTSLFSMPSTAATIVTNVRGGDILILVPMKPEPGWKYVVDFNNNLFGWVKTSRIDIIRSSTPQHWITFTRHPQPDENSPALALRNDSKYDVRLRFDDRFFLVPGGTTTRITVTPGTYSYVLSVAGHIPLFGTRTFGPGAAYTWSLYENKIPSGDENIDTMPLSSGPVLANPRPAK